MHCKTKIKKLPEEVPPTLLDDLLVFFATLILMVLYVLMFLNHDT